MYFIYTLIPNSFYEWFYSLGISFSVQTLPDPSSDPSFRYTLLPIALVTWMSWILIEALVIFFTKNTLLGNLFNFKYINLRNITYKLTGKIIMRHTLLLLAVYGIPTNNGFYYIDNFGWIVWGAMIFVELISIILSKGEYSFFNFVFGLRYKKSDTI
jgi:hypothetical protein